MSCFRHSDDEYIKLLKQNLSENSVKSYSSQMKRILRILKPSDGTNITMCQVIHNSKKYIPLLEKKTNNMERLQLVKTILAIMKHAGVKEYDCKNQTTHYQDWYAVFEPLNKQFMEQRESNEPTQRQKLSQLDWEKDIVSKYQHYAKMQYGSMDHLLLAMYTLLPPRRQVDYFKVLILDSNSAATANDDTLSGTLDLTAKKIEIIKGKTIETYQEWTKELSSDLIRVIKASLRKHPRIYLFVRPSDGLAFPNPKAFTKYSNDSLKRIFNNPHISVNSFRHAFASFIHQQPMKSLAQLKQISKDMGHSIETNMSYVLH